MERKPLLAHVLIERQRQEQASFLREQADKLTSAGFNWDTGRFCVANEIKYTGLLLDADRPKRGDTPRVCALSREGQMQIFEDWGFRGRTDTKQVFGGGELWIVRAEKKTNAALKRLEGGRAA